MNRLLLVCLYIFVAFFIPAEESLTLLSWNVESGGNSPAVIAEELEEFRHFDLVTLVEVDDKNRDLYTRIFSDTYDSVLSQSGARYNDHILVIFNENRLELLEVTELHEYQGTVITPSVTWGGKRSPLILHLRDRLTGAELQYVSVHLERSNDAQRKLQALVLRSWILDQTGPVIAAGDFNFDYSFGGEPSGNDSFRLFTYDPGIDWIEPEIMVDTNYSEKNGLETYPDSILDFVFAAHITEGWDIASWIIVREGDFPDTEETSDHRPVAARIRY